MHRDNSEFLSAFGSSLLIDDYITINCLSYKVKNSVDFKVENGIAHYSYYLSLLKIAINADNEKSFTFFIKNNPLLNGECKFLDNDETIPGTLLYDLKHCQYLSEYNKDKYIKLFKRCGGTNLKSAFQTKTHSIETQSINNQSNSCIIF